MTKASYTEEFKEEAVRQVIERGYTVPDVADSRSPASSSERQLSGELTLKTSI